jgi:hypothetical protein
MYRDSHISSNMQPVQKTLIEFSQIVQEKLLVKIYKDRKALADKSNSI